MRDFTQILAKTLGIFFLVFFSVLSVFGQSALRLVVPIVSPTCFNGVDDDSDGFVDYPDDNDCENQSDQSENHLTATCSASSLAVQLGQSVVWTVVPTGWSTTYTYLWSGSELSGTTETVSVIYLTAWSKDASVTITSGFDSLTIDCTGTVSVISSEAPTIPSSSGGWSGGNLPVTENLADTIPIAEISSPIDVPEKLNSAPEESQEVVKEDALPKKTQIPRVKIKTQLRITLQEESKIGLTNEPIPAPPRADNMPLFDVISELSGISMNVVNGWTLWKVAPWEILPVSVKLLNVSGTRRLDVQIYYSVFSWAGESVYSSSETVAVETTASFVKMVQIPYHLIPGVYTVKVSIKYDGQIVPATSHFPFTVESKMGGIFRTTLLSYIVLFIVLVLVIVGFIIFLRKKYHQISRSSPVD